MTKPTFQLRSKDRKNNTQISVHTRIGDSLPRYAGTLTFDDKSTAEAFLVTVENTVSNRAEMVVDR